jgi:cobaltochelatase CobN
MIRSLLLPSYPFSALVGQEAMKLALLLAVIDPAIGGVLLRGSKGAAKSTAVRALHELLPIKRVAPLALRHRQREALPPPAAPPPQPPEPAPTPPEHAPPLGTQPSGDGPLSDGADASPDETGAGTTPPVGDQERVFEVGSDFAAQRIEARRDRLTRRGSGRRSRTRAIRLGRYMRAVPGRGGRDITLDATIRAAAPEQPRRPRPPGMAIAIRAQDLRERQRDLISATGNGIPASRQALARLEQEYPGQFTLQARTGSNLADREQAAAFADEVIRAADALIVLLHGGAASCPHFDLVLTAAREGLAYCYIHPSDEDATAISVELSSGFGSPFFAQVQRYVQYDGAANWRSLLCLLAERHGLTLPYEPPQAQPTEALYHPDTGIAATLAEHLAARGTSVTALRQSGRPVVGVCFYPSFYDDGNITWADALIREVERQGSFALDCFYMRMPDPIRNNRISDWVVDNYFMDAGEPLIHVLINVMAFAIRLSTPAVADVYARLGVPVLQAMLLYLSHEEWRASMQGTTIMEVASNAAQPEFDGALIALPIATHEALPTDALTGATLHAHLPIPERVASLVRLALRWAKLRLIPNAEKRVAIIFHNYPATNERIGCATGLDSLESVVNIVRLLAAEGYMVERDYASGEALIAELLAHATNDERWQTPDALAARAVALVPPAQYQPWLAGLPADRRAEIVRQAHEIGDAKFLAGLPADRRAEIERDWGAAPGPILAHDGQVIITGVINGNLYIGLQPPRGFAHDADKVHDPLLPPPAYLLSYRWVRDVFRADAVIHVGTHGTLEWMPFGGRFFAPCAASPHPKPLSLGGV